MNLHMEYLDDFILIFKIKTIVLIKCYFKLETNQEKWITSDLLEFL